MTSKKADLPCSALPHPADLPWPASTSFGKQDFLVVGSERGTAVAVYDVARPWAPVMHQLSGMVADRAQSNRLYAVPDSYYKASRIFNIDASKTPAVIDGQIELRKSGSTVDYDLEG